MPALAVRSLLAAVACLVSMPRLAHAQPPFAAPPPPAPEPPPAPVAPPAILPPPAPVVAAPMTDHESIVGRYGIEARRLGTFQRTPGNDLSCNNDCPIDVNAISVRHWRTAKYAWSAGLALGFGGGSRYSTEAGKVQSWDTYFGFGPAVGASFLLADWHHLVVSASPQLDAVYFIPRGTGSKTLLIDVRGLVEGELHLGFIGLPQLSVGAAYGLQASLKTVSKASTTPTMTASQWDVGFSDPLTLWGLVTNAYLRFYF